MRSEAVTLNLKASNSTLFFCCASERKRRPPGDFIATVSLSVPHFWAGEGGGVGFLFWEPLQLCVAGEENGLFSDNSNPRLNKGQASSLLGPVGVLYLQLKYWDALCQNVKRKNTQERLKMGAWLLLQSWIIPCWVYLCQMQSFIMLKWVGNKIGRRNKGNNTCMCDYKLTHLSYGKPWRCTLNGPTVPTEQLNKCEASQGNIWWWSLTRRSWRESIKTSWVSSLQLRMCVQQQLYK